MTHTCKNYHDSYGGECRTVSREIRNSDAPLFKVVFKLRKKCSISETIIPAEIVLWYFWDRLQSQSILILSYIPYKEVYF